MTGGPRPGPDRPGGAAPGPSILVVDDNPANLRLVRVLLSVEGYDVRTAMNADETMAVLERFHPDLILMDIQLPGVDGLTLTRRIKQNPATSHVLVVALTAYAMKGDEERILAAGCDGYVAKPIDTRALPQIVARYLDGRRGAPGPRG